MTTDEIVKEQAQDKIREGATLLICPVCGGEKTRYIQLVKGTIICSCGGTMATKWTSWEKHRIVKNTQVTTNMDALDTFYNGKVA